jgi:pimeloyl-ACP methyl ester carboxylesterase
MRALKRTNERFEGANSKQSLLDIEIPSKWNGKVVIFSHGFMGFKDWGAWNLVQSFFVYKGFGFLKYNCSHNGGTLENPIDFPDLESFGKNTYTKELIDNEHIINLTKAILGEETKLYLIGHSRGGGIVLLQSQRTDISGIAAWAPISDIAKRFIDTDTWQKNGVRFQKNGRTNQELPMSYEIYEDYIQHQDRLNIREYCKNSTTPTIVIHGDADTSVLPAESEQIAEWLQTKPLILQGAQHTFNSSHPWESKELPTALKRACEAASNFFLQN